MVTKATDREVLEALATYPDPVATSTELAKRLPITQQAVYKRLQKFEEQGWVRQKSVGANATVWWLEPSGRRELDRLRGVN